MDEADVAFLSLSFHFLTAYLQQFADFFQCEGQLHFLRRAGIGQDTQHLQAFAMRLDKRRKLVALDHDDFTLIFHLL